MRHLYSGLFAAFTAIVVPACAQAQCSFDPAAAIVTIAGNHTVGYSGDGGAGTSAQMGSPYSVASDQWGNFYIADYFNNVVRRVSPTGTITTVAGTGEPGYNGDGIAAVDARLNGPAGVTLAGSYVLFIADKFNERIRRVDLISGIITTVAGNGLHGGDNGNPFGNGGQATAACLTYPVATALDCSGNMYVVDQGSQTIRIIFTSGIIQEFAGTHFGGYNGDEIPATNAHLNHPSGIAADCSGNVYISDTWNNRIRLVTSDGNIHTFAGNGTPGYSGDGSPSGSAMLWGPWGINLGPCGDLFIADYDNNVIRRVSTTGIISTFAGTGTRGYTGDDSAAVGAELYLPSSISVNMYGSTYIADYGNAVVRFMGSLPYSPRAFNGGTTQTLHVCKGTTVSVDKLMSIADAGGSSATWSISSTPDHGTVTEPGDVIESDGLLMPSGIVYTPSEDYTGRDEFTVLMSDGNTTASTTISVIVDALPDAGVVTQSAINNGTVSYVSSGVTGGIWSTSDNRIATIDAAGVLTALTNGIVSVSYTVANDCGAKTAVAKMVSEVTDIAAGQVMIFPNPNNGTFRYDFNSASEGTVHLTATDLTGRVVYKQQMEAKTGINTFNIVLPSSIQRPSVLWLSAGATGKPTAVIVTQ